MLEILDDEALSAALAKVDVQYFSRLVFERPYADVAKIMYPVCRYKAFYIAKRDGSRRLIQEPRRKVKELQYKVLAFLQSLAKPPKSCVHGFVTGRSIVTNANVHCDRRTRQLLNVDLEDFFPSINFFRVRGALQAHPFGLSFQVASMVAHLCTKAGLLPQGAPTSPFLSNIICRGLDRDLMSLARRHRANYTRYADDLTFSFAAQTPDRLPDNICSLAGDTVNIGEEFKSIIESNGFVINDQKTRLSSRRHRLEVTGLAVNKFPNVRRKFVDQIRGALHAWEKYGYVLAQGTWEARNSGAEETRFWRRQTGPAQPPQLKNVLRGKLLFLRMVKGRFDPLYTRLADKYNDLCRKETRQADFQYTALPVEKMVLSISDARRAVFVVEWSGDYRDPATGLREMIGGQGTAFLYKDTGLVTCDHIFVATLNDEREVDFSGLGVSIDEVKVIDSENMSWPVRLVHRDTHRDLAVVQFTDSQPNVRHFVPSDSLRVDGEIGLIAGYPDWSAGRPANFAKSEVVVSFVRRGLRRFEISANIRRGNSGGPFLDATLKVAGIGQRGASQISGSDECLNVLELEHWLDSL